MLKTLDETPYLADDEEVLYFAEKAVRSKTLKEILYFVKKTMNEKNVEMIDTEDLLRLLGGNVTVGLFLETVEYLKKASYYTHHKRFKHVFKKVVGGRNSDDVLLYEVAIVCAFFLEA